MKITPYLYFNGNCAEAVALYEKAFGFKALSMPYSDMPSSEGYQAPNGTENYMGHTCLTNREDYTVFLSDTAQNPPTTFGNGMSVCIELDSTEKVKSAFDILKEHGTVGMELQQTFWNPCFGTLTDRFGVGWMISVKPN